jgi:hypothetical protein
VTPTRKADKPAEFFSDEHKQSHLGALLREREGYVAKVAGADEDSPDAHKYQRRVDQVDDELKRLGAAAKIPKDRAEKR